MPYISANEARANQEVAALKKEIESLKAENAKLKEDLAKKETKTTKTTSKKEVKIEAPAVDEAPVEADGETK